MTRRLGWFPFLLIVLVHDAEVASSALVLNEILYDPEGPDGGFEWVELYNSGPWEASLVGLTLEAGDGSRPGQWSEVWAGRADEWIPAGGFFWIGGAFGGRTPDSVAELRLQNGPDGVRLLKDDLELDRVGWGELEAPEYFEGAPAAEAVSGRSLARKQDGFDSDRNLDDFEPRSPTPGRWNTPEVDLAIRLSRSGRPLPVLATTGHLSAILRVENRGSRGQPLLQVALALDGLPLSGVWPEADPVLEAGEALDLTVELSLAGKSGPGSWTASLNGAGDGAPENDQDTLRLWIGPPPLRFSEISPRPDSAGTEWVELAAAESGPVALRGWTLEDAGGTRLETVTDVSASAGDHWLLAREPERLLDAAPLRFLVWEGSWPALNNTAPAGAAADSLFLWDPDGCLVDWAAFGSTPEGGSWIRLSGPAAASGLDAWTLSPSPPGATPGEANPSVISSGAPPASSDVAPLGFSLQQSPGGVWIRVPSDFFPASYRVRIHDLNGRLVWHEVGEGGDRVERWERWDGRDRNGETCPAGVYFVELESSGEGGRHQERLSLVLGR